MDDKVKSLQDFVNVLSSKVAAIEEEIGIIASGGFMPAGSVYFADLPSLDEHRYGYVYNIKDAFTTTSDFIEGAGKSYPAGADVGIIHDDLGQLKYDVLAGFIDTSAIYSAIDEKQSEELSKQIAGETTVEGALEAIATGSSITVDTALDITSTNALQNKVIKAALDDKLDVDGKAASAASADFATKATNDGHDNNIANTYATKTELGNAVVANPSDIASVELTKLKVGNDVYSIPHGGHSIKDNGTAMANESALNFTDFDISDDGTNNETDIKAHRLTSAELLEICSPLPGVMSDMPVLFDERGTEYQVGWCVLANGTKKPVYKKEFTSILNASVGTNEIQIGERIDSVLDISGCVLDSSNTWSVLNCVNNGLTELTKMYVRTDDYSDASGKNKIIVYNSHTSFFNCPVKISIKYTKTNDTPV